MGMHMFIVYIPILESYNYHCICNRKLSICCNIKEMLWILTESKGVIMSKHSETVAIRKLYSLYVKQGMGQVHAQQKCL